MKIISLIGMAAAVIGVCTVSAQTPSLRHVFDIRAEIGTPFEDASTAGGKCVVIPITGGEIVGDINGTIQPGGADRQQVDTANCVARLCATYNVLTTDSTLIHVVNEGINCYSESNYYFFTSPRFECPRDSRHAWLNDRIFVCRPVVFAEKEITLRVWVAE